MTDSPGKRLRAAREARKLSVEDITAITKMRPSIINALEADDYTSFPSITHARNFLSLYGKQLKVDVTEGVNSLATPAKMGIENYQYLNVERHEETSFRTQRRPRTNSNPSSGAPRNLGIILGLIAFLFFATYLVINLQRLNLAAGSKLAESASAETTPEPQPASGSTEQFGTPAVVPETSSAPFYAPTLDKRRLVKPRPSPRF